MSFKQWLFEYEGSNFSQEQDLVNGPQYPNSKYKGPGDKGSPDDVSRIDKKFGFGKDDELLKLQPKRMKKRMKHT